MVLKVKNPPATAGDMRDSGWEDPLEKGNPLEYSHLEEPWTEEPGRLQSTGSQRVGPG